MLRIAERGWNGSHGAETADDVTVGVGCWWVEVDGVRIHRVVRAELVAADDEFSLPRLILDIADGVQIVYVGEDGEPLPGEPVPIEPGAIPPLEHRVMVERPS